MNCWSCGAEFEIPRGERLSFRASCDRCSNWLHSCKGCRFFKPGLPNSCMIPDTTWITDREARNFCEDFKPKEAGKAMEEVQSDEVEKKLFGDTSGSKKKASGKERFKGLFGDE